MASASTHQARIVPAFIEKGRVVDVDIERYTLSAVTEISQKSFSDISFATPYQHFSNGEGIYFMPEVGSLCWLCWPSDNAVRPFVLAWASAREDDGSMRAKKMQLNPGDIVLSTRDENFIILRRGGIVQIGGGPLCQRIFMPVNNTIKDFCENYQLNSLAGDLEWTLARPEASTDGKRPALLSVKAREFANDETPIAVLEIGSSQGNVSENGSHTKSAQNILSLAIKESGERGSATKISLEFRKDGTANWLFESSVTWTVKENLTIDVTGKLEMTASDLARMEGKTVELEAAQGAMSLRAKTTVDVMAGSSVNLGPQVNMGVSPGAGGSAGLLPVLLADSDFLNFILNHKHKVTAPGQPSGPANDPTTNPDVVKVLAKQGHKAKKSFGK